MFEKLNKISNEKIFYFICDLYYVNLFYNCNIIKLRNLINQN